MSNEDAMLAWLEHHPAAWSGWPSARDNGDTERVLADVDRLRRAGATWADGMTIVAIDRLVARLRTMKRARYIAALAAEAPHDGDEFEAEPDESVAVLASSVAPSASVDGVKAHLLIVTALVDRTEIDASLSPAHEGRKARPAINTGDGYAQMNQRTA